uniref:Uncharacterized protein n=1 Tax=Meloidogyne enterolobii TaxID=390850 RepID=A0A6V7WJX5_MELEN|nr:unnamed protein product [Meloidogyne enterolobii]
MIGLVPAAAQHGSAALHVAADTRWFLSFLFFKFNYQNNFFYFSYFFACGGVAQHGWVVFMVWLVFFFIFLNN